MSRKKCEGQKKNNSVLCDKLLLVNMVRYDVKRDSYREGVSLHILPPPPHTDNF